MLVSLLLAWGVSASAAIPRDRFFETSDGVQLHYVEAGSGPDTLIFVPGWLMPAAVFDAQVRALSERFRVISFDPRSQGKSEVCGGRHTPERRSRDIHELLQTVRPGKMILVGWSLGVLEVLDYLARYKPDNLFGLVLIDNSIGEGRPPVPSKSSGGGSKPGDRAAYLREFTLHLTNKPLSKALFETIYASARQVPQQAARELINKPYPREYWRDTVLAQKVPILYAIRPRFEEQGRALRSKRPDSVTVEIFPQAGHALFLDEPARFNNIVSVFAEKAMSRER